MLSNWLNESFNLPVEAHFNTKEEESKTYDSGLFGSFVFLLSFPVLVVLSVSPLGIVSNLATILVG